MVHKKGTVMIPHDLVMLSASGIQPVKPRWRQEVLEYLAEPGHHITLLAAHDNMMTAFLMALEIFKDSQYSWVVDIGMF